MDRNTFGPWLSGFAASRATFLTREDTGEGPALLFTIDRDDPELIQRIRDYWGVEIDYRWPTARVSGLRDIVRIVVPHFRRYPLIRLSRERDFERWCEDVHAAFAAR